MYDLATIKAMNARTLKLENYIGKYIDTDGILPDLDGTALAEYLTIAGYKVVRHYDAITHGRVILDNGLQVSTNGYVSHNADWVSHGISAPDAFYKSDDSLKRS